MAKKPKSWTRWCRARINTLLNDKQWRAVALTVLFFVFIEIFRLLQPLERFGLAGFCWLWTLSLFVLAWVCGLYWKRPDMWKGFWGISFGLVMVIAYLADRDGYEGRKRVLCALIFMWGLRHTIYQYRHCRRNSNRGNQKKVNVSGWIRKLRLLAQDYIPQALFLILAISPSLEAIQASEPSYRTVYDYVGLFFWIFGFLMEAYADMQFYNFRADARNYGEVLSSGLYRYSTHPHLFGASICFWGIYLICFSTSKSWYFIWSPLIFTLILYLQARMPRSRRGSPAYVTYVERTPCFLLNFGLIWDDLRGKVREWPQEVEYSPLIRDVSSPEIDEDDYASEGLQYFGEKGDFLEKSWMRKSAPHFDNKN